MTLIQRLIFALKYKRAVKQADKLAKQNKLKYYVIYINGELKVVPKKTIRHLIATRRFKKGTKIADIEKRALYITHNS